MAQMLIRNLDDHLVERLKLRARAAGRSLEAEVRNILEQDWRNDADARLTRVTALAAMSPPQPPGAPLAQDLVREDRDSR